MEKDIKEVKLTKDFVSYGHYRLNVELGNGRVLSAITGDAELISDIDSEVDVVRERAIKNAIEFVASKNK